MKKQSLFAIALLAIIFSCGTEKGKITEEFNTFKVFTDSLLTANSEYLKGSDTMFTEVPSLNDPEVVVIDTMILSNRSNIFDTSQYIAKSNIPTLNRYNTMEQHLDSAKNNMDEKTLALFESIKQKMNAIKQPIK